MRTPIAIRMVDWAEARPLVTALRTAVFVIEQHVPLELELDQLDASSVHAVATAAGDAVVATGRLLPDGHIGRLAVARAARGRGIGSQVLQRLLDEARQRGHERALLNSQLSAVEFYARHGFTRSGEVFMDAGIEHIGMYRSLR